MGNGCREQDKMLLEYFGQSKQTHFGHVSLYKNKEPPYYFIAKVPHLSSSNNSELSDKLQIFSKSNAHSLLQLHYWQKQPLSCAGKEVLASYWDYFTLDLSGLTNYWQSTKDRMQEEDINYIIKSLCQAALVIPQHFILYFSPKQCFITTQGFIKVSLFKYLDSHHFEFRSRELFLSPEFHANQSVSWQRQANISYSLGMMVLMLLEQSYYGITASEFYQRYYNPQLDPQFVLRSLQKLYKRVNQTIFTICQNCLSLKPRNRNSVRVILAKYSTQLDQNNGVIEMRRESQSEQKSVKEQGKESGTPISENKSYFAKILSRR